MGTALNHFTNFVFDQKTKAHMSRYRGVYANGQ
jgi:hypothetical protein